MESVLDLPEKHGRALQALLKLIPPKEFPWVLTGSGGLRLQGVNMSVHDLDIETDEQHIRMIEKQLAEYFKVPVHAWDTENMKSLDGKAEIEGIEVELLAEISHLLPDGTWTGFTDFSQRLWLQWNGQSVPVFPLEIEAKAYESMGRHEKAGLIRETIRYSGKQPRRHDG